MHTVFSLFTFLLIAFPYSSRFPAFAAKIKKRSAFLKRSAPSKKHILIFFRYFYTALKKTVTIFFLAAYLLSATEVHQLFKLPVMFEHYKEHRQLNTDLGFITYVYTHYMNDNLMDGDANDDDRDMELPFKASGACVTSAPVFIMQDIPAELDVPQEYAISNDYVNENDFLLPTGFLSTIFQPPKA